MGIFGNDREQDRKIDGMEEWLQGLTRIVQQHKLELVELKLEVKSLQAQMGEKVSARDVDPSIVRFNDRLAEARELARQASQSADENWRSLQEKAMSALDEIYNDIEQADFGRDE